MNKKIMLAGMLCGVLLVGCGGTKDNAGGDGDITPPAQLRCPGAPLVILDNDNFDPDWVPTLVGAIGMDQKCNINLMGVMVNGTDIHGKAGLMYNSVLTYYGIQDRVPVGINHHASMRTTPTDATNTNPKLDSAYSGTHSDITEFPSDGLMDSQREDTTALLCEILSNSPQKITYATGGHLQNIESLMKETNLCNGMELIRTKIDKFIIGTGWSIKRQGKPEMNLSEGQYSKTPASIATNYVFSHMPAEVPIIFPGDGTSSSWGQGTGNQYKNQVHIDSPMAFIMAVNRYGTFGDHGLGDSGATMYAAFGNDWLGNNAIRELRKTCFIPDAVNGAITLGSCDKNHWLAIQNNPQYVNTATAYVNEMMNLPTEDGKI